MVYDLGYSRERKLPWHGPSISSAFKRLAHPLMIPIRAPFELTRFQPRTAPDDANAAATFAMQAIDFVAIETEIAMRAPWNQPHFCEHEGPWTRRSCSTCDVREAKIIIALIAWLTDQQDVLDKIRPAPYVYCSHPGATIYEPCRQCRIDVWFLARAGHRVRSFGDSQMHGYRKHGPYGGIR